MLVRSPTSTKFISGVSVNGSSPESLIARLLRNVARGHARNRLAERLDMGGGAAAAADDIDQTGAGELADHRGHFFRRLVIAAEFVGQSGVWMRAYQRIGSAREIGDIGAQFAPAPSAQLKPMANGFAWRSEYQNASGVWPVRCGPIDR